MNSKDDLSHHSSGSKMLAPASLVGVGTDTPPLFKQGFPGFQPVCFVYNTKCIAGVAWPLDPSPGKG